MLEYVDDPISGMDGLRPFTGTASKITIHRTETSVKPNWQEKRKGIPHYTLDHNKAYAHISLDMAAYTMVGGDFSPNSDAGVNIQIEWVGYARNTFDEPDEDYASLAQLISDISIQTECPWLFPFPFSSSTSVRQPWERFEIASGIVGHGHAPWNTHWDPGALDISRLLAFRPLPEYVADKEAFEKLCSDAAKIDQVFDALGELSTQCAVRADLLESRMSALNTSIVNSISSSEAQIKAAIKNIRLVVE